MAKKESYNDMLNNLEEILSTLEKDELSLEEAMKEYEKGSKLINKLYMGFDMFETVHKLSLYMMNIEPDPTTCYNLDL